MIDVSLLKTPEQARTLMVNAKNGGRMDIYQEAFRRLCQIQGIKHMDRVVVQFWEAISAVEEILRQKHGKAVKANYSRRKAARVGEIQCLIDWALKKSETEGFRMLVEAGLGDQTGEYVVVANAERFPSEVVAAARLRLEEHGIRL